MAEGKLTYVVGTNLTYRMPELLTRDWYVDVDVSKYAAYFVVALNHDMSVSSIIDPLKKIENLLASRKYGKNTQHGERLCILAMQSLFRITNQIKRL